MLYEENPPIDFGRYNSVWKTKVPPKDQELAWTSGQGELVTADTIQL